MRKTVAAVMLMLLAPAAFAGTTLAEISWSKLKAEGKLRAGEVVSRDGLDMLKVTNSKDTPLRLTVLKLETPRVSETSYSLRGTVAYEDVAGKAYLEMLSCFPQPTGGPYYTRTVAEGGPLQYLTGTSYPRDIELPFNLGPKDPKPIKIELNVFAPGKGTIYIGPMRLLQTKPPVRVQPSMGHAIRDKELGRKGGYIGSYIGGLGALMGLIGGTIGTLCGMGKARRLVLGMVWFMIVFGGLCILAGMVSIVTHQWWVVYVPLLYLGLLTTLIAGVLLPGIRRRYDELELRRISAQDAMG